jgi:hypothetical protein
VAGRWCCAMSALTGRRCGAGGGIHRVWCAGLLCRAVVQGCCAGLLCRAVVQAWRSACCLGAAEGGQRCRVRVPRVGTAEPRESCCRPCTAMDKPRHTFTAARMRWFGRLPVSAGVWRLPWRLASAKALQL